MASHPPKSAAVVAVGYLRRSTNRQEKSLDDQRREIERYAAEHGYTIIRWYQDDGISGDATEKRAGFLAMHKAACNGRDFEVILCWDQDRFGRFNSMEAGYYVHPLMRAGVTLVTVNEGPIAWDDFTGRVMYSLKQEGKHQFLRDLSRNVTRGQITIAGKGYLCGQAAPYGYDRMLVDEAGQPKQRVHNREQVAKPRSWHVTLVQSDDPTKVQTLRWLFEQYANSDIGLRSLADDLNTRGIVGPAGGLWHLGTIREILRNAVYTGDFIWAKRRIGKYHRVAASEIKERSTAERKTDGEPKTMRNSEAEWIVNRDAHAALVDRDTFARVQAKLSERKGRTTAGKRKNGDGYVLSGLVFCAHCGAKMYGTRQTVRRHGKVYHYHKYICSTYHTKGRNQCGYNNVRQEALLPFLIRKLRDAVLCGGHREELACRVRERLESRQKSDPTHVAALVARLAELDRELELGTKRLLKAPDEVADLLGAELARTRRDRDRLGGELAALGQTEPVDLEAEVEATVARLWRLADELEKADPARLRELVRRMVVRIDLWFDAKQIGPRVERPLSKGCIDLRPDPLLFKLVSRGDRI